MRLAKNPILYIIIVIKLNCEKSDPQKSPTPAVRNRHSTGDSEEGNTMFVEANPSGRIQTSHSDTTADPCIIVIFGASGDLCRRKIIPALFNLYALGELSAESRIIGFARRKLSRDEFISSLQQSAEEFSDNFNPELWQKFSRLLEYFSGAYDSPESFNNFKTLLGRKSAAYGRLYYLATPPTLFRSIIESLHAAGLLVQCKSSGFSRVIIEKPFGIDLNSALDLNQFLHSRLSENQIYRIDHYLGKNTVQNLLFFRFANAIFEPLWNRNQISHITITSTEKIGVENRGGFYESAGVIRDFIQNHLLQLLSLIAMEQPVLFNAEEIRNEKVKVLRSLRPLATEDFPIILGQYTGYRQSQGVAPNSQVPTFAAIRVMVDNWRWQGVPFYIVAGKALEARRTECCIHFKRVPTCIFGDENACANLKPNTLTFGIQPQEEIKLEFVCKSPGDKVEAAPVLMDFNYERSFDRKSLSAYERLILDAIKGDATLFAREDETEAAWKYITPLLEAIQGKKPLIYPQGSAGPEISGLYNHLY